MPELSPALEQAPVALILLDPSDSVVTCNGKAASLGIATGEKMSAYLPGIEEPFVEHVRHQPPGQVYRLASPLSEKRCKAVWLKDEGSGLLVWLLDVTEQLAIASRVREEHHPETSKLRQLNQLAVTASGYAELIEVVMEDEQLAAGKLSTLRQYHAEVTRNLTAMLEVLRGSSRKRDKSGTILVADSHQDLATLISELLRAEGYKAESFCDASSALRYLRLNGDKVTRAIIDEEMCDGNRSLIDAIRPITPSVEIVALSAREDAQANGKLAKPVDFEKLLELIEGAG